MPGGETIEEILRDFEETRPDVGALGVNWQMHTSNHQLYRAKSIRKTYLECIFDDPDHNGEEGGNKHVKSIVRTDAYGAQGPSKYLIGDDDFPHSPPPPPFHTWWRLRQYTRLIFPPQ